MRAGDADNRTLVLEICAAALHACRITTWPSELDPARAPELVHTWMAEHLEYFEEGDLQVIRLPRALALDRVGDCKSTAVTAAALLHAAGHPVRLRFIRQRARPWWSHVYAMAGDVSVDPLLPLGSEAERTAALDYHIR